MNELQNKHIQEAVQYFKQSGFKRLMQGMIQKYESLGRVGGNVKLEQLNKEEQVTLTNFFGTDYGRQSEAKISLKEFTERLQQTRYKDVPFLTILAGYAGRPIITKADAQKQLAQKKQQFFEQAMSQVHNDRLLEWLQHIQEKGAGFAALHAMIENDREADAVQFLRVLINLFQNLQEKLEKQTYERLPFLAQRVAGNPHSLDRNQTLYPYFLNIMQWLREETDEREVNESVTELEKQTELLQQFYLYRDDISNFVSIYGLTGQYHDVPSKTFLSACEENRVLNVPLREVLRIELFSPFIGQTVLVVENSGVFSELVAFVEEKEDQGRPNLSAWTAQFGRFIVDGLFKKDRLNLVYAGDWDPEGLLIAERLLQRYPTMHSFYGAHYSLYNPGMHNPLSTDRLKKLASVRHPELQEAKQQLQQQKKAFYQEQYTDELKIFLQQAGD